MSSFSRSSSAALGPRPTRCGFRSVHHASAPLGRAPRASSRTSDSSPALTPARRVGPVRADPLVLETHLVPPPSASLNVSVSSVSSRAPGSGSTNVKSRTIRSFGDELLDHATRTRSRSRRGRASRRSAAADPLVDRRDDDGELAGPEPLRRARRGPARRDRPPRADAGMMRVTATANWSLGSPLSATCSSRSSRMSRSARRTRPTRARRPAARRAAGRSCCGRRPSLDQAGPLEHLEVLGDGGERHVERAGEVADRPLALGEHVEHPPPRLAGERVEHLVERDVLNHVVESRRATADCQPDG